MLVPEQISMSRNIPRSSEPGTISGGAALGRRKGWLLRTMNFTNRDVSRKAFKRTFLDRRQR